MNTFKKVSSLGSITNALFEKFGKIQDLPKCTKENDFGELSLSICDVLDQKRYGPLTLVHQDFRCFMGKFHTSSFEIYDRVLTHNSFDEFGSCKSTDADLTVFFSAFYPSNQSVIPSMYWAKKKGYWVEESINLAFGGPIDNYYSYCVSSEVIDNKHFLLALNVQTQVYDWMQEIAVRGHWEYEWNPKGIYLKKP